MPSTRRTNMSRTRFEELLLSTQRKGIDNVLLELEKTDFFKAPASSRFHLACEGGLLQHSLNVYDAAMILREQAVRRDGRLLNLCCLWTVSPSPLCSMTHASLIYIRKLLCHADWPAASGRSIPVIPWTIMKDSLSVMAKNQSSCSLPGGWICRRKRCSPFAGTCLHGIFRCRVLNIRKA